LNLGKFTKASGRFRDVDLDKVDRKPRTGQKSAFGTIGEDPDSIERRPLVAWPLKFFAKMMADENWTSF